jgi:hypothetical protein
MCTIAEGGGGAFKFKLVVAYWWVGAWDGASAFGPSSHRLAVVAVPLE